MNKLFYRAWDPHRRCMYRVTSLQWDDTTPGLIGYMDLEGFDDPDEKDADWSFILDRYILMQGIEVEGKILYAGDILDYPGITRAVVYFDYGSFKTETLDGFRYHLEDSNLDRAEVMGNMHQHPELFTPSEKPKRFRY